jgi:hypothetical protein
MRKALRWAGARGWVPGNRPMPAWMAGGLRLIFVLGSQRSGTNALRRSLSLDPDVAGYRERESSDFYHDWKLRPEAEIRPLLLRHSRPVLLKPIGSVIHRPVSAILREFAQYPMKAAWIYRDPVNVFASQRERWPHRGDVDEFCIQWNRVNGSALEITADPRVAVVRYEDMLHDGQLFHRLSAVLGVKGENLFRFEPHSRYEEPHRSEVERIRRATGGTLERLDAARQPVPAEGR